MVKWLQQASTEDEVNITGLPWHRENREFESPFSKQGKRREFAEEY